MCEGCGGHLSAPAPRCRSPTTEHFRDDAHDPPSLGWWPSVWSREITGVLSRLNTASPWVCAVSSRPVRVDFAVLRGPKQTGRWASGVPLFFFPPFPLSACPSRVRVAQPAVERVVDSRSLHPAGAGSTDRHRIRGHLPDDTQ